MQKAFALALLALSPCAMAQAGADNQGWTFGLAAGVLDSPYVGEGTRVRPFPLVSFEGERFFWRGLSGGMHLYEEGGIRIDALLSARLDGFDIDDLSASGLRGNGLNPALLEDRDDGLDAGFRAQWQGGAGQITFQALGDVSGASDGYELSLEYGYRLRAGRAFVTPYVGAEWRSSDLTRYYYGTLDEEVARGVQAYAPGSVLVPRVGVNFISPLAGKWQIFASAQYRFLPDELTDSPLLERGSDGAGLIAIGLSRGF